jgi:hypothetical protein
VLDGLVERVRGHMEGSEFGDDFTLLAVERQGG